MKKTLLIVLSLVWVVSCSPKSSEKQVPQQDKKEPVVAQQKVESATKAKAESPASIKTKIKESQVKDLMGTYVGVDVCIGPGETDQYNAAMDEIWLVLGEIHWRMSKYSDKGDVYDMNHAQGQSVTVKEDTYHVLSEAQRFNELSQGAFDITIGPLIDFWKRSAKRGEFPLSRELKKIKESIGMSQLTLEKDNAVNVAPNVSVDLGGIAKGFAIDEAVRILREHKLSDFLVDAGGDVYVAGMNCTGKPWHIGVRHPDNPTGLYGVVEVSDVSVTTSGDYEQSFSIKGQKLSHIINPITGYPQKGVISSTVIAPNALEADALSTSISILGPQKGIALMDQMGEGYAGMILYRAGPKDPIQVFESANYAAYKFEK